MRLLKTNLSQTLLWSSALCTLLLACSNGEPTPPESPWMTPEIDGAVSPHPPDASTLPDAPSDRADAPRAVATTDAIVRTSTEFNLDGSESEGPAGGLSFTWVQTAGPAVEWVDETLPVATLIAPSEECELSFQLTVTDALGRSAQTILSVEVVDLQPDPVALSRSPFRSPGVGSPVGANPFSVAVEGDYAYVAAGHYGVLVYDYRDFDTPRLAGSFHTPYDPRNVSSSGDIVIADGVAYVAAGPAGLHILDITRPEAPTLLSTWTHPEMSTTLGVVLGGGSLFVMAGRDGIFALDIGTPSIPRVLSRLPAESGARRPVYHRGTLYVLDGVLGVSVVDVSEPRAMRRLGYIHRPVERTAVYSLAIEENSLFIGTNRDIRVLDVSDPMRPREIETIPTPTLVMDMDVVSGTLTATAHHYGLLVFDVTDPSRPRLAGSYNAPDIAQGVRIHEGIAFVADGPQQGIVAIDIQEPTLPTHGGHLMDIGDVNAVDVEGDRAVLVTADGEVVVADVSTPHHPRALARQELTDFANTVRVADGYAYVATDSGVDVVQLLESGVPLFLGHYEVEDGVFDLRSVGSRIYAVGGGPLNILDMSSPARPELIASVPTGYAGFGVLLDGDRAFVSTYYGLMVTDIATPSSPRVLSAERTTSLYGWGMGRHGDRLFVADEREGLHILDITDLEAPRRESFVPRSGLRDLVMQDDSLFLSTTNEGLERYRILDDGRLILEASFGIHGTAKRLYVEGDEAYIAAGRTGLYRLDTGTRVHVMDPPLVTMPEGEAVFRVRWDSRDHVSEPEILCRVTAGACEVAAVDTGAREATIHWTAPADEADYEILVIVGDQHIFTSERTAIRVRHAQSANR